MLQIIPHSQKVKCQNTESYIPANKKTKSAISGTLALLFSSMKKQNPAASNVQAMFGNVNSSRFRRPKVSIVLCQYFRSILVGQRRINNTYPYSGERKDPIYQAKPKRREKCRSCTITSVYKNCRGVKCDDVDATHLLCDHYHEASKSSSTDAGNGEKFREPRDIRCS